ncbi:uncharacterized protein LTR77_002363 [Saxophila tyrrhenica]|uniref:Ubiquitin-like domain-containing protein n=1 Tax=Saxophila tyrrhenica TaxID=1690608 RepID=A0AAV9PL16_9PEZI|nr:hypothetical protein LTR77_002363 [Saxophila tyrrhenica]
MPPSTVAFVPPAPEVEVIFDDRPRHSSGRSASIRSHPTSRGSGSSGRHSISGSEGSWKIIDQPHYEDDEEYEEEDDLEPGDSASRARQPLPRRYTTQHARPEPTRRHSSRRIRQQAPEPDLEPEIEEPRRRHSSRRHHSGHRVRRHDSHRAPSDESSSTVASSHDDYPYSHHGMPPPRAYPPPPGPGFRHGVPPGHGGYPPSAMTSQPGYPDGGYGGRQALVHMPQQQQDPFGYPIHNNPFSPQESQQNPFSPMSAASGPSYFAMDPHAPPTHHHRPQGPPRPQSFVAPSSHYGSEMMSPYGHPGMPQYPGYPMPPMPGYPMPPWYQHPPSHTSSPAPAAEKKEEKNDSLEALQALFTKNEESRAAWHKEILAKAEADAAAAAEKRAREEEEKKKKEEIADATKKAKEAAEQKAEEAAKKAKDEHEKKLKEAETAREEALKKQKELEEEAAKLKPPDHAGKNIKFKDAMDRKYSFPFYLCKTWKGMEGLIKQAFMAMEPIGEHVRQGRYDLTGPDGEIILPQVWENMVQPDWEIEMHMWPIAEEKKEKKAKDPLAALNDPFMDLGLGDLGIMDPMPPQKKKSSGKAKDAGAKRSGTAKRQDANIITVGPDIPPPPPNFPPGMLPDPLGMAFADDYPMPAAAQKVKQAKGRSGSKSKGKDVTGLAAWFAGNSRGVSSKKR